MQNWSHLRQSPWIFPGMLLAAGLAALAGLPPAAALLGGVLAGALFGNAAPGRSGLLAGGTLQAAVLLLGFGLPLGTVLRTGRDNLLPSLLSIAGILAAGLLLGRLLRVGPRTSTLISGGTAICGGSAIATLAPLLAATAAETGVSLAVVFLLNGVALFVFPVVGAALKLSPDTYAHWCALAIHDTSSVAGAAAAMGEKTLALALTIKLTRALWIIPLGLVLSRFHPGRGSVKFPWALLGFLLASALVTLLPAGAAVWSGLAVAGRRVMVGALFLVGYGIRWQDVGTVGPRALLQGFILWLGTAATLLLCLR